MTRKATLFLLAGVLTVVQVASQHSPNSLQAAIEALHRHHEILSSQSARHHAMPPPNEYYADDNDDYPYGESPPQPGQLNRALADYLAREEERERMPSRFSDFEDDDGDMEGFAARKRSIFRERGEVPYKSVFRERGQYGPAQQQPELAEEFLEEMEREQEEEEEDQYRQMLHRLWDKYQQQENSIERELFDDNEDEEDKKKRSFDLDDRKKRYGFLPMYFGPAPSKRRDYPLLPWLSDARKKRFPVRKRSAKPIPEEPNASGTSGKVAKDLQALFGNPEDKKKRSTESVAEPMGAHQVQKKSVHHVSDSEEDEEDEEHDHETDHDHEEEGHDHGHEHEHEDDSEEEEDEERKKKRSVADEEAKKKKRDVKVKSNPEVVKEDQIIPGDLSDYKKKKDVHWDKYFGYDKRKKRDWGNGKYQSMVRQPHPTGDVEAKRKKKQSSEKNIASMDDKLKNIEDLIIEETVKYTGAHEGISDPREIQKLKDRVISRLATAYSLEKMRHALDRLHENVDTERHLLHNEIEPLPGHVNLEDDDEEKKKKKKRVAIKKDQGHSEGQSHGRDEDDDNEQDEDENDKKKKKRKRNGLPQYDEEIENSLGVEADHFPDYAAASQCPMLNAMEKRCRGVDILSGDIHQELLPICAVHQLCYLCGTSQTSCDLQYLSDADAICGKSNGECESAARSALMILRGAPGPQLGPRECARNSCLYNAIRDIAN